MDSDTTHFGYQTIKSSEKSERVRAVFQSVAKRYDLMNDLMSFGLHRLWKRIAVQKCALRPDHQVLDLAGGTGDLTALIAKELGPKGRVFLTDINEDMLSVAKNRLIDRGLLQSVEYLEANAECLPFENNRFHCVIMGFGLRNVTDKARALIEIERVLKPGGRAVILEFSEFTSKHSALSAVYDAYSHSVLPMLGKLICNDADSYRYLAESIRRHPNQESLKDMMEKAGLQRVSYQNLNSGIVALHTGFKF
jgi:demethylmenaquinone methyltransferase / 2-methoxy-6-polyprenyl-1,4-benzoquinol methylase